MTPPWLRGVGRVPVRARSRAGRPRSAAGHRGAGPPRRPPPHTHRPGRPQPHNGPGHHPPTIGTDSTIGLAYGILAALALAASATGCLLTLTALALTALTALTAANPARRREARTLLALLLNRRP
ncbi:hypothetical protein [Streptomyces sp. LS1784]|uniref:hypothetical protein n=1 Tax=Streptomyces sp. LS1784 TaxID=2851533 RepID=UPI001CCAF646|nr:hypothetical protein [Streptomyces sp. LS1784]